jgi:hypothetical protein
MYLYLRSTSLVFFVHPSGLLETALRSQHFSLDWIGLDWHWHWHWYGEGATTRWLNPTIPAV